MNTKFGIVEDINDPGEQSRVRVRVFGMHPDDLDALPTQHLPWSNVVMPNTSPSISGIGETIGLLPGSMVLVSYLENDDQTPIVIGSVPSRSTRKNGGGFRDPSGIHPKRDRNDSPLESSFRSTESFSRSSRLSAVVEDVPQAVPPRVSSVADDDSDEYYERSTWSLPSPDEYISPKYPYNNVKTTESGHVTEIDDTPGFERRSEFHPSGTFRDWTATGDEVNVIRGKRFTIINEGDNVWVKGSCNLTIEGDVRHLIRGNYHLEVEGNYTECVKGTKVNKYNKSLQEEIGQEYVANITESRSVRVGTSDTRNVGSGVKDTVNGDIDVFSSGEYNVSGSSLKIVSTGDATFAGKGAIGILSQSRMNLQCSGGLTVTGDGIDLEGACDFGDNASFSNSISVSSNISAGGSITAPNINET